MWNVRKRIEYALFWVIRRSVPPITIFRVDISNIPTVAYYLPFTYKVEIIFPIATYRDSSMTNTV